MKLAKSLSGRIYQVNKIKGVDATSQCPGGCKGTELRVIDNRHLFAKGPYDHECKWSPTIEYKRQSWLGHEAVKAP